MNKLILITTLVVATGLYAGGIQVNNLLDDPSFTSPPDGNLPTTGEEMIYYNAGKNGGAVQYKTSSGATAPTSTLSFTAPINLLDDTAVTEDSDYNPSTTKLTAISPNFNVADIAFAGVASFINIATDDQNYQMGYEITLMTTDTNYTATSGLTNIFNTEATSGSAMEDAVIAAWNTITWDTDPFVDGGITYETITGISIEWKLDVITPNTVDTAAWFTMESATIGYTAATVYTPPSFDPAEGADLSDGTIGSILDMDLADIAFGTSSTTSLEIAKSGTIRSADKIKTDGSIICDGVLNITLLNDSDPLEAGDAFDLFDGNINGAISGQFHTLTLPSLAPGLEWFTAPLYTQGFIWVREINTAPPVAKPNIIILFADDLGYADCGFQPLGASDIITPNIDTIAANGVTFTAGYACGPVCSPSRGGLMTGQYQNRFALHDTPATWHMEDPATGEIMQDGIPTDMTCFGHRMQDLGYATGMIGKWHGGDSRDHFPPHRGFDEFFGFNNGATSYYPEDNTNENLNRRIMRGMFPVDREDEYITDAFGREAVSFINRHAHEPFYLYVPFNAPHGPMTASDEHSQILFGKNAAALTIREKLISMVYSMDLAVGNILDAVRTNNIEEDTMIIFFSDNGGTGAGGGNESYNTPLRGVKGDLWDGGIRVPFCMQWKDQLPEGLSYDFTVSGLDLLPTAVNLAGGSFAPEDIMDGNNLIPAITGQTATPPNDIVLWWHNDRWVARDNEWKLVDHDRNESTPPGLYRIIDDISETTDLYPEHPAVVERLYTHYTNTLAEFDLITDASRWSSNTTYHMDIRLPEYHVIYEATNVAEWVESAFPGTDMDNDGISNLEEYLLGLPVDSPSVHTNGLSWNFKPLSPSNRVEVTYRKRVAPSGENNIPAPLYNIEQNNTLTGAWNQANAILFDGPHSTEDPDYEEESYRMDVSPSDRHNFFRLVFQ
ncbi:sulfatase-like hydrolase/transferase [Pontiella desulfatans]|uniref:sulfatase-like hydrolase/transferase n=1 Tax=Pontiella desulfatans TaxID=2750659 RepID=UPI00109D7E79|nr:sulfatase-like hydrolase/transferase [Pontiella desulfatans]